MNTTVKAAAAFMVGYVGYKASRTARAQRIVHVALDRPIAYKITIESGTLVVTKPHTRIDTCAVINTPTAIRIDHV